MKRKLMSMTIALALGWACDAFGTAEKTGPDEDVLNVGLAAVDISPAGSQVLDPLYAKAIVLLQGKEKAALVECDLIHLPPEVSDHARRLAAEKTGIPAANICIAATHTHNGVRACDDLPGRIAQSIVETHASARPARLETGVARQEETISFNRRYLMRDGTVRFNPGFLNPDIVRPVGPIDPEVGIVLVRQAEGNRPVAAIVNFALHACTVGRGGVISADYPYALERAIRRDLGERFLCMYAAGACGDVQRNGPGLGQDGDRQTAVVLSRRPSAADPLAGRDCRTFT